MKIKELMERECCSQQHGDLSPYKGLTVKEQKGRYEKVMFCRYCGQVWKWGSRMDAAGGKEDFLVPIIIENG